MRSKAYRLLPLTTLMVGTSEYVSAQRAGLWEGQVAVDGKRVGSPLQECRSTDAQLRALQAWPVHCSAKPLLRTASGIITEARCNNGRAGPWLSMRHELTGDLDRRYQVVTSSQIDGAATTQPPHRSTVTLRYLGPCPGKGTVSGSDAAGQPMLAQEPLPIVVARIIIPPILVFGSIAATSWFFRRRWRDRRDQATVTNIGTGAAGDATIPVLVTFTGVRGLPWWYGIAMNNAAPLLVIEPDGIRFRVIRRQRRSFDEIECVDVRQAWRTVNLGFTFRGSIFTFAANVGTVALAEHIIASLASDVPLSSRAQALRATW